MLRDAPGDLERAFRIREPLLVGELQVAVEALAHADHLRGGRVAGAARHCALRQHAEHARGVGAPDLHLVEAERLAEVGARVVAAEQRLRRRQQHRHVARRRVRCAAAEDEPRELLGLGHVGARDQAHARARGRAEDLDARLHRQSLAQREHVELRIVERPVEGEHAALDLRASARSPRRCRRPRGSCPSRAASLPTSPITCSSPSRRVSRPRPWKYTRSFSASCTSMRIGSRPLRSSATGCEARTTTTSSDTVGSASASAPIHPASALNAPFASRPDAPASSRASPEMAAKRVASCVTGTLSALMRMAPCRAARSIEPSAVIAAAARGYVDVAHPRDRALRRPPRRLRHEPLDRERVARQVQGHLSFGDLETGLRLAHHEVLRARRAVHAGIRARARHGDVRLEAAAQLRVGPDPRRERLEIGNVGGHARIDGSGRREFPAALAADDERGSIALDAADALARHVHRRLRASAHGIHAQREIAQPERQRRIADAQVARDAPHVERAVETFRGMDVPVARDHQRGARQRAEAQAAREVLHLQPGVVPLRSSVRGVQRVTARCASPHSPRSSASPSSTRAAEARAAPAPRARGRRGPSSRTTRRARSTRASRHADRARPGTRR